MGAMSRRHGCTIGDLRDILAVDWTPPSNPYDEVYPGIYIGDAKTATDVDVVKMLGVTHVLNAAQGVNLIRYVNTSPEFYALRNFQCEFLGIPAMDLTAYQLHPFFLDATEFIDSALSNVQGKILVHCREGVSRSPTLVLAYLMIKKDMTAVEAIRTVRSKRQIFPNDGFLEQLCDLDLRLRGERSFKGR